MEGGESSHSPDELEYEPKHDYQELGTKEKGSGKWQGGGEEEVRVSKKRGIK